jgi:hypothetical protein
MVVRKSRKKGVVRKKHVVKRRGRKTATVKKKKVAPAAGYLSKPNIPSGYTKTGGDIFIRTVDFKPVRPGKLQKGFEKAQKEIKKILNGIQKNMGKDYSVSEIQMSVSFDASGKFLGIGIGGSTQIMIKVVPSKE